MRIFSIDPGLGGAFAVVVDGRPTLCGDMPVSGEGTKRRVQASVLANIMRGEIPDLVVIEQAWSRPTDGGMQAFRFGVSYGAVVAIPQVLGIPVETVTPQLWKLHYRLKGEEKEQSRQKALDLYPWLADQLRRKLDQNRAEAVLIGCYGAKTWDHARAAA